jgi:hypothetical protein
MSTLSIGSTDNHGRDAAFSPSVPVALALSAMGGATFGGLTQLGQSFLPDWLRSVANSAAPWVVLAFGFALLSRALWAACASGFLTLASLELGYVAMAAVRGYPSAVTTVSFWLLAAVVFGPPVGLGAYLLRIRAARWGAAGGGLLAGIVSGEGLSSYLRVRDTTTPGYWVAEMLVGLALLGLVCRRAGVGWAVVGFVVGVGCLLATGFVSVFGA